MNNAEILTAKNLKDTKKLPFRSNNSSKVNKGESIKLVTSRPTKQEKQESWEETLLNHVNHMNKNHCKVFVGGKFRVLRQQSKHVAYTANTATLEYFAETEIKAMYRSDKVQIGEKRNGMAIFKDAYTAWAEHPKCRKYTGGVIFSPCADQLEGYLNLYNGFAIEPIENHKLFAPIMDFIGQIICDNHGELFHYVMSWIALTFQHPDKSPRSALVLRGDEGTGKGTFTHFLGSLWGNHFLHVSQASQVIGKFNYHLMNTILVNLDEAFFSGSKEAEAVLKALVTEENLVIERKGMDAVQQRNYLKLVLTTNSAWAVPVSTNGRRFAVCDVSSREKNNPDYWANLKSLMGREDVKAAFLFEMLRWDISTFNPSAIPETEGLKAQRMQTLQSNPLSAWIIESFQAGKFYGVEGWQSELTAEMLKQAANTWAMAARADKYDMRQLNSTAIGKELTAIGFDKRKSGGNILRCFGDLDDARKKVQNYYKITLDI